MSFDLHSRIAEDSTASMKERYFGSITRRFSSRASIITTIIMLIGHE